MLLALDIGNSRIKAGLFEGPQLKSTFSIERSEAVEPERLYEWLRGGIAGAPLTRAGITSVVPALTPAVIAAAERAAGVRAEMVHAGMPLPFRMGYETPQTLGSDRLAAAAGAWRLYGTGGPRRSIVVVDAGTAVTYEVIDRDGRYRGGAIAPGPLLLQRALNTGTAQLPAVPLELPAEAVGRSTQEALQSGIMYGFIDSVSGMLARIRDILQDEPFVVATGGWGSLLHDQIPAVQAHEPHLVLHGIRMLVEQAPISD